MLIAADGLTEAVQKLDSVIWSVWAIPIVLAVTGLILTLATGFVQVRRFPSAVRMVIDGLRPKGEKEEGTITPFQALSTALASTVGNGNIGGVATAILLGGPGAIFWMWVCGILGMATKYSEAVLGVHYRVDRGGGDLASGPMYYITQGVRGKPGKVLALMFAFFGLCTALLGTGNMAQSNTIVQTFVAAAKSNFDVTVSPWVPGVLITFMVGAVLLGGIQRIAGTAEKLVPTMIVIYFAAGFAYIVMNADQIPTVFGLIIGKAFSPMSAVGGFAGASVAQAIQFGVSRGVLSNEAGLGSAPIAHGIAKVDHPVEQGMVGVFEVFIDTILVCTMTSFIILSSGLWKDAAFAQSSGDLTAAALNTSIPGGPLIVALCSFLFGFSTLIGWYYYGEKCFEYIFGTSMLKPYKVIYIVLILVGAVSSVPLVWAVGSVLNGFMAFPNLIGLSALGGTVAKLTKDYFSGERSAGKPADAT